MPILIVMEKLDIFNYSNFRIYLKEFHAARQSDDPEYTRSHMCRLLGIPNSRSYVNEVIQGRKVTASFMERFVEVLELDDVEAQYFRILVKMNQSGSAEERKLYFEQLLPFFQVPVYLVQRDFCDYYRHWYNSAIRAVIETTAFSGDFQWLSTKLFPAITEDEARESVALLERLGLIEQLPEGEWALTEKSLKAADDISREMLIQYNMKALELAREALHNSQEMHTYFATNTITISSKGYSDLMELIRKFRTESRNLINNDDDSPDRVYQINMQLFPLARHGGENE